ncbi:MAG: 2-oxoglutarate dehydrogenase component [Pseudomonadota bacterium]
MDNQQFTNRNNLEFIEQLYTQYKSDPQSISNDWKMFFDGVEFAQGTSLGLSSKELDVYHLINAYRNYGHFEAQVDPLSNSQTPSDELSLARFNLKESDLNQSFQIGSIVGKPNAKLKDIIAHLRQCYCGKLTVQAAEALPNIRNFFIKEFEQPSTFKLSNDEKLAIHATLNKTEGLEKFIHTRFVGTKRFSVEGGDALLPMLEALTSRAVKAGVEEIVFGMAHRGRLNVLVNYMEKNVGQLLAEFSGPVELTEKIENYDSDVKYHMGAHVTKKTAYGPCEVTMAYNPSHLEAVNPVVIGMARAAQRIRKDTEKRKKVIPMLIHGDAAFAGQGIVAETLQMSQVRGYRVGGTIHLVIDNQVGFTTNPENSRSSHYASDIAKILAIPVLHVNGDDVESCIRAIDIALRYRQQFGQDMVINMTCYRRFGHNEGDEPAYTQPQMYEIIKKHPTLREIYSKQLQRDNVINAQQAEQGLNDEINRLQGIFDEIKAKPPKIPAKKFEGPWAGLRRATTEDFEKTTDTKVDAKVLQSIGETLASYPKNFNPHPKLLKLLESRRNMALGKEQVDWGMAELLAYGSLLNQGTSIRLTGQDVCRGTFTHRHAVLCDHKTGEYFSALTTINTEKVKFCVYDSVLSEYGVLGFEYGNSVYDPRFLTLWEAQFGDFTNGAQIIIDQFIASAETKWQQMSGLVMLLPHGFEGQGPEHSSARLERFLQLCAQNNMQVMNLTTPAQIYHSLRRQMCRPFRKPMVVMSPKLLLRHPKAVSSMDELANGSFQEVIDDASAQAAKVEQIILCSGKVYYELLEEQAKQADPSKFAIIRIEQLYPFPEKALAKILSKFKKVHSYVWAQEEPKNNGAWSFVFFKLHELLKGTKGAALYYAGRDERSSPAVGATYKHKVEQQALLTDAFTLKQSK